MRQTALCIQSCTEVFPFNDKPVGKCAGRVPECVAMRRTLTVQSAAISNFTVKATSPCQDQRNNGTPSRPPYLPSLLKIILYWSNYVINIYITYNYKLIVQRNNIKERPQKGRRIGRKRWSKERRDGIVSFYIFIQHLHIFEARSRRSSFGTELRFREGSQLMFGSVSI